MPTSPPFYPNTEDGSRCLQASTLMALESIFGDQSFTLEKLDGLSGKGPELYTWPLRLAINLAEIGLGVKYIDRFDLPAFIKSPEETLEKFYGAEVALDQMKNSDIPKVQKDAREFVEHPGIDVEYRTPEIQDISNLVSSGYMVICNVNQRVFQRREGYVGHFVLIFRADRINNEFTLHNPGPPPAPNLVSPFEDFERAWAYAGTEYKNILAIRRQ